MKRAHLHIKNGFSLIEVILSTAVFVLFVTALAGAYLYGEEASMLAGNRARAVMLAEEGAEAVRNIRDLAFTNLIDGTYGLATTSNQYNLSGANDTNGLFTRSINIATVDTKRKDITTTVTWQQNAQRVGEVSIFSRLTNWMALGVSSFKNLLVYGDGTTLPKTRNYDDTTNTFSLKANTASSTAGRTFVLRTSPKQAEAITGFVTATGVLNIMCYDGVTWTNEWSVAVGGTGTTRRFDIAYETNSGDVLVLYSTNATTNNELAYRTKSGGTGCGTANWSGATNLSAARTSGMVHWVKMAWDRRAESNLISALWADANADLSAIIWDGANWVNEPNAATETSLELVAVAQDVESFDLEYESLSGDLMLTWANSAGNNGINGVRYRTCTGGLAACTWSAIISPPTFANDATNLDLSANPNSDEMVFASIGNAGSDLQIGYWSGSAWTNSNDNDVSCYQPAAGTKLVSTGWLISGGNSRSIIAYNDSGARNIGYFTGNLGVFTQQTDFVVSLMFANPQRSYQIEMDPLNKDRLMFCLSDNASDLFCKRLVMSSLAAFTWTNSDLGALETSLTQAINSPFSFAYSRN